MKIINPILKKFGYKLERAYAEFDNWNATILVYSYISGSQVFLSDAQKVMAPHNTYHQKGEYLRSWIVDQTQNIGPDGYENKLSDQLIYYVLEEVNWDKMAQKIEKL